MNRCKTAKANRVIRPVLLGVLLLYGFGSTAVPLADSIHHFHVHSHDDHHYHLAAPCSVGHDALTVPLCQFVGLAVISCSNPYSLDHSEWYAATPGTGETRHHVDQRTSFLGPRGPPAA